MWLAPAAQFIESAADGLKSADPSMLAAEVKELASFGDTRIAKSSDVLWPIVGDQIDNTFTETNVMFAQGYLLGLQVARTILAGSPQLAVAGIKPDSLL